MTPQELSTKLRSRLLAFATPVVEASVRAGGETCAPFRQRESLLLARLRAIEAAAETMACDLDQPGFHGAQSVHAAWRRHPEVARVFSRYHLPSCDRCPVGNDETLAEAARGHGIALDPLLLELNGLLAPSSPGSTQGQQT